MFAKVMLASALAATASANLAHPLMVRSMLAPRATDAVSSDSTGDITENCFSVMDALSESMPTPPPEILSEALENTQTDPCSLNVPASLSSQLASYESELSSWASVHMDELVSAVEECPDLASLTSAAAVCSTGLAAEVSASATAMATATSNNAKRSTNATVIHSLSPTSTETGNVAAHKTGMLGAAFVAAGFVVAAL